jgi:glycosyltransferase involved in cell wall biosynthesis
MKVTILIPTYNEEKTILKILNRVNNEIKKIEKFNFEIIVIDDFSNDKTLEFLEKNMGLYNRLIKNEKNYGKGYAIRKALENIETDIVLIQDADLEYNPSDYNILLRPFLDFDADVVYGSRFRAGQYSRVLYFWHSVANFFITLLSNFFTNLNLTDVETGYKVFKYQKLKEINLIENSFTFEIEVTQKLSRLKPAINFYETGISYFGRSYSDGKKIGLKDAFKAFWCILKYGIFSK